MLRITSKTKRRIVESTFSVMILGFSLFLFSSSKENLPAGSMTVVATPTSAPTARPTATVTPLPTSTPTPTPTPTPSLAEQNALIPVLPAEDETGRLLSELLSSFLHARYTNDRETLKSLLPEEELPSEEELSGLAEEVTEISGLSCYYKEGLSYADYLVYACYQIRYAGSNVFIPTIEEYGVSYDQTTQTATVFCKRNGDEVAEALTLSRASESVRELYIKQTILRYMNAKLALDESILTELVTDSSLIDLTDISTKTQYIEYYSNANFIIRECPKEVSDIRYIVYVSHDVKIINIATLAPGAEEFMISIDENQYPKIFFGTTSKEADAFLVESRTMEDYLALYNDVTDRLAEAIRSDSNLREFMQRIYNATNAAP